MRVNKYLDKSSFLYLPEKKSFFRTCFLHGDSNLSARSSRLLRVIVPPVTFALARSALLSCLSWSLFFSNKLTDAASCFIYQKKRKKGIQKKAVSVIPVGLKCET